VGGNRRWCYVVALTALAACAFLWLPAAAPAGGCYTASSHVYGYSAYPTYYSYPSYYTYATPVTYTPKYQVEEILVPKAVRAYVNADYFSSSSDFYRDALLKDAVAGKVTDAEKLRQEVSELKALLKAQPQQPAYQPQYQMPAAVPQAYSPQQYAPQPYAPAASTPCEWKAQAAYQQGYQQAQAALQQQGGPGPPQGQGYGPPQGQGYQQPAPQPQTGSPSPAPAQPPPPPPSSGYGGGGRDTPPESNGDGTRAPRGNDAPPSLPPAGGGRPPEAEANLPPLPAGVPRGLQEVVTESCIRCHGPKNEEMGAGFDMTNLAAVPAEGRMESYAQVLAGAMPHKSAKLPREKARLFREWFRAATQTRKVAAAR
jgi:hypothetical protein